MRMAGLLAYTAEPSSFLGTTSPAALMSIGEAVVVPTASAPLADAATHSQTFVSADLPTAAHCARAGTPPKLLSIGRALRRLEHALWLSWTARCPTPDCVSGIRQGGPLRRDSLRTSIGAVTSASSASMADPRGADLSRLMLERDRTENALVVKACMGRISKSRHKMQRLVVQWLRANKKPPQRVRVKRQVQLVDAIGDELPAPADAFCAIARYLRERCGDDRQQAHAALHRVVSEVRAKALDSGRGTPLIVTEAAYSPIS